MHFNKNIGNFQANYKIYVEQQGPRMAKTFLKNQIQDVGGGKRLA